MEWGPAIGVAWQLRWLLAPSSNVSQHLQAAGAVLYCAVVVAAAQVHAYGLM